MITKKYDNSDAIIECFNLYEKKMYHIAFSILNDNFLAEDAVMGAFVKLLNRNKPIADPASDETKKLIINTIRSVSIDMYRKNKKLREREFQSETGLQAASYEENWLEGSNEISINELLSGLPRKYADVLFERYHNGLSVKETAQALGITEGAVRKRQERALKMLKSRKESNGYA